MLDTENRRDIFGVITNLLKMEWSITKHDEEMAEQFADECYTKAQDNKYLSLFCNTAERMPA